MTMRTFAQRAYMPLPRHSAASPVPNRRCFLLPRTDENLLRLFRLHTGPSLPLPCREEPATPFHKGLPFEEGCLTGSSHLRGPLSPWGDLEGPQTSSPEQSCEDLSSGCAKGLLGTGQGPGFQTHQSSTGPLPLSSPEILGKLLSLWESRFSYLSNGISRKNSLAELL